MRAGNATGGVDGPVIVVGYDTWTEAVIRELRGLDVEFVVIVPEDGPHEALRSAGVRVVVGAQPDQAAFSAAGIGDAGAVVVATLDDHWNVLAVLTAAELSDGVEIVSFASSPDATVRIEQAGADVVLDVGRVMGRVIGTVAVTGEPFASVVETVVAEFLE